MPHGRRGPNSFVRFLGSLLRFERVRRFRQIIRTVLLAHILPDFRKRVVRYARGIRTHIGNQADQSLIAQFHTFV